VYSTPRGWWIWLLARFNLSLLGGYGRRSKPMGRATHPSPLPPIMKVEIS